MQTQIMKTKFHSWCSGNLSEGCKLCVKGRKLVLFITGLCGQRCWYCPISEEKFSKDVVYANEWRIKNPDNPEELFKEAELTEAKGAGITGGDPLMRIERCCLYIKQLKQKYGKQFHIHLYTPLKLVTKERLQKLYDAGLDEIRFHPNLDDDVLWNNLELAQDYCWATGIEIPAIPEYGEKTKRLIDFIAGKINFINLNELEHSDTLASHYSLDERGYRTKDNISYGIRGSKEIGLEMLEYAQTKGVPAHFCTAKLKDAVQLTNRIKIRATNAGLSFDIKTTEGMLVRGIAYLPELKPEFGYRKKLEQANKQEMLKKLRELKTKIMPFSNVVIDENKLRLILPAKEIRKSSRAIKQLGAIPAIVEEYPTHDATETEITFL
ncbi:radical SAM protein [Candidatus Woesearchaeota archaeon]|nr:radical SAM protein [Candidatus Woesearchaeota archaeon]